MALNMSKGLIRMPDMELTIVNVNRRFDTPECPRGFDWLGFRPFPKVLVLHRAQTGDSIYATLEGYFHSQCCPALTDLEVNHRTGVGKRFVNIPGDSPSGWASGPISAPYGDGALFHKLYPFKVNTLGESCEILGRFNQPGSSITVEDPLLEPAIDWLAQWIASRAHDYGITYLDFPIIKAELNRSIVTWHEEFTFGTGKVCPGDVVKDLTSEIIRRAKLIMEKAQTGGAVEPVDTSKIAPDGQAFPEGLDHAVLSAAFGVVYEGTKRYSYNPGGGITKAWYKRGKELHKFPFLYFHWLDEITGREFFGFSDGSMIWKPASGQPFRWG
jgi:hypothetical protein